MKLHQAYISPDDLLDSQLRRLDRIVLESKQTDNHSPKLEIDIKERRENIKKRLENWDLKLQHKDANLVLRQTDISTRDELIRAMESGEFTIHCIDGLGRQGFARICRDINVDADYYLAKHEAMRQKKLFRKRKKKDNT